MELEAQQEDLARRTTNHQIGKLANGLNLRVTTDSDDNPVRKMHQMKIEDLLSEMSDNRATSCWSCDKFPATWVREIVFDLGKGDSPPERKTALAIDAMHYVGPLPGFCSFHLGSTVKDLVELVYNGNEVIAWGFRPTRWFVIFTDGSMARGNAIEIDPLLTRAPVIKEQYDSGT